jgi:hypothetical protein
MEAAENGGSIEAATAQLEIAAVPRGAVRAAMTTVRKRASSAQGRKLSWRKP